MSKQSLNATAIMGMLLVAFSGCAGTETTSIGKKTDDQLTKKILFISNGDGDHEIYLIGKPGAPPVQLTDNDMDDTQAVWSPDGKHIAFTSMRDGNPEIYIMGANGGHQVRLTQHAGLDSTPQWSPDGSRLVFVSNRDKTENIYVMNIADHDVRKISDSEAGVNDPKWSPDGKHISYIERISGAKGSDLILVTPDGAEKRKLTRSDNNKRVTVQYSWSPDSSKIAVAATLNHAINIYSVHVDGTGETQLTNTPEANDVYPQWSPDGKKILFLSQRDNMVRNQIYLMNDDGSGQENLTKDENEYENPAWTPDGNWITFSGFEDRRFVAGIMRPDGTDRSRLSNDPGFQFQPLSANQIDKN